MRRVVTFALLLVAGLAASAAVPLVTAGTAAASEARLVLEGHPKGEGRNVVLPATGSPPAASRAVRRGSGRGRRRGRGGGGPSRGGGRRRRTKVQPPAQLVSRGSTGPRHRGRVPARSPGARAGTVRSAGGGCRGRGCAEVTRPPAGDPVRTAGSCRAGRGSPLARRGPARARPVRSRETRHFPRPTRGTGPVRRPRRPVTGPCPCRAASVRGRRPAARPWHAACLPRDGSGGRATGLGGGPASRARPAGNLRAAARDPAASAAAGPGGTALRDRSCRRADARRRPGRAGRERTWPRSPPADPRSRERETRARARRAVARGGAALAAAPPRHGRARRPRPRRRQPGRGREPQAGQPGQRVGRRRRPTAIQGFATDISVNVGDTVAFKVKTDGDAPTASTSTAWATTAATGARKIATVRRPRRCRRPSRPA